ncbi:MAG: histidine kinase [Alteromonas sp.]|nr:histidine kinase [Alteromonas sp.]
MSNEKNHIANERVNELEARVNSLERQLKRQKIARKNAESFLETYSQDAYLANQALRKSLQASKQRERELLYLSRSASQLGANNTVASFIFSALESAVEFCQARCGKAFIVKNGDMVVGDDNKVLTPNEGWIEANDLSTLIVNELPLTLTEGYAHWCVNAVERDDTKKEARVIHFMHELADNEFAWLALLTEDDNLDEETLYILDTTKHYLNFGLRYQLKSHKLSHQEAAISTMQEDRKQLEERLVSADKMAMLGQLAAGIAHEINNPIGYVRSNTTVAKEIFNDYQSALEQIGDLCREAGGHIASTFERLEKDYALKDSAKDIAEMFEESSEGIERIIDIVKALRSFSYPNSDKRTEISATEAFQTAIKLTNNLYRYKNNVIFCEPEHDVTFKGNSGQIQQVLINFLTNAIYATAEGKNITLKVERDNDNVLLIVEDEGAGMSAEVLNKVFTPFYTTKPPGEGTGLGMSISLTIVEEHGGKVDIYSTEGVGTRVVVSIPCSSPED